MYVTGVQFGPAYVNSGFRVYGLGSGNIVVVGLRVSGLRASGAGILGVFGSWRLLGFRRPPECRV